MIYSKVVTAGPRGNKCRKCKEKAKAPDLLLKMTVEFNRFSGHPKIDNFCAKCGKEELENDISTLKEMTEVLEHGPSSDNQLGSRKVRSVI